MSRELLEAVRKGNIEDVRARLQAGDDINYQTKDIDLHVTNTSPLGAACFTVNLKMVEFLLNYQYTDDKDKVVNLDMIYGSADLLNHQMIRAASPASFDPNPTEQPNRIKIIGLLLSSGANISAVHMETLKLITDIKLLEMFCFEALLRGKVDIAKEISTKRSLSLDPNNLFYYLNEYLRNRPSESQLGLINKTIDALVGIANVKQGNELKTIIKDVAKYKTVNYPDCMKPYIDDRDRINRTPLESIINDFQTHLSRLKCFGDKNDLQNSPVGPTNDKTTLEDRNHYSLKQFIELIDPKNRTQSVYEMYTYGLLSFICQAALHKDLPEQHRVRCMALLRDYQNTLQNDKRFIAAVNITADRVAAFTHDIQTNAATAVVDKVSEKFEAEIASLKSTFTEKFDAQQKEIAGLQSTLTEQFAAHQREVADMQSTMSEMMKMLHTIMMSKSQTPTEAEPSRPSSPKLY